MKIDETTGLPEVPEGYFWRLRYYTPSSDQIQLRKKNKLVGSKKIAYDPVLSPVEPVSIRKEAERVYRRVFEGPPSRRSLYGDYPPKSLNG